MKIRLNGNHNEIIGGLHTISEAVGFSLDDNGIPVTVEKTKLGHEIHIKNESAIIKYSTLAGFFRAVSILIYHLKNGTKSLSVTEEEFFNTAGVMIDVSRGTVQTVKTIKKFLVCMARMGLNMLMLYTEDVYKLDKYPYFGYMRGAYTESELKEIVSYAETLGIEVIPCIQTLGHLAKALRWKAHSKIKDTQSVILIDEEETYIFIEEMLKVSRRVFKSKKIHIGMDEAHDVGLGKYLTKNGYVDRYTILMRHLERVVELCKKYDFDPMMWSDMFFRLGSKTGDYYDTEAVMPENIKELIPNGLSQVYWDYYHTDADTYQKLLNAHKAMGDVIFAGGVWTWTGFAPRYNQTVMSTYPALKMCREAGVRDIFATIWFSDYSECNLFTSLLGLQIYAEYQTHSSVTESSVKQAFLECMGLNADAFISMDIDNFENAPKKKDGEPYSFAEVEHRIPVISKEVMYQDILTGLFDKNFSYIDIKTHFENAYSRLLSSDGVGEYKYLLDIEIAFADVVRKKCDMGIRLKDMYDRGDKNAIKGFLSELSDLRISIDKLHTLYSESYYNQNKPFGFEEMDMRFGGIKARIERAAQRITDYIYGKIDSIPELEEDRLTFENRETGFVHLYYTENMRKA